MSGEIVEETTISEDQAAAAPLAPVAADELTGAALEHDLSGDQLDTPEWQRTSAQKTKIRAYAKRRGVTELPGRHILSLTCRHLPGGRGAFVAYIRLAAMEHNDDAKAWLLVYDDLTAYDRQRTSLDDICAIAGTRPSKIMAAVVAVAMEQAIDTGNLIAAISHPKIVRQTVKSAERIGGAYAEIAQKDRMALLLHEGFIPAPKGAVINVSANAHAQAAAAASESSSGGMPRFVDDVESVRQPVRDVQQKLISGENTVERVAAPIQVADAELVEVDR